MYLIEVKGRRMLLISSVTGLFISVVFMAGSFLMINKYSAVVVKLNGSNVDSWTNISTNEFNLCNGYRWVQLTLYREFGNYPTPYSKIYLDTFFAITFDRNNHTLRSWCHFKATNVSFKKTPRSRCIEVPNKSYDEKLNITTKCILL